MKLTTDYPTPAPLGSILRCAEFVSTTSTEPYSVALVRMRVVGEALTDKGLSTRCQPFEVTRHNPWHGRTPEGHETWEFERETLARACPEAFPVEIGGHEMVVGWTYLEVPDEDALPDAQEPPGGAPEAPAVG